MIKASLNYETFLIDLCHIFQAVDVHDVHLRSSIFL